VCDRQLEVALVEHLCACFLAARSSDGVHATAGRLVDQQVAAAEAVQLLEAQYGDPLAAFEYLAVTIRNHHDAVNTTMFRGALAVLATFFDRLGRYEPAATIFGFGVNPLVTATNPGISAMIAHLRDVLGEQTYESLARKGESMTTAAMVAYAYDQIDQARAELNAVLK
jgi:hypothetical protein